MTTTAQLRDFRGRFATLAARIEREELCGCEHEWTDHLADGLGYRVCQCCPDPFVPHVYDHGRIGPIHWGCVIDRGGYYGMAPIDYVRTLAWLAEHEQPDPLRWSPDAYRYTPEPS